MKNSRCPGLIVQIETREQAEALAELPVQLISSVPALIQACPANHAFNAAGPEHPARYETEWLQAEEIGTLTRTTTRLICTSGFNVTNSEAAGAAAQPDFGSRCGIFTGN